MKEIMNASSNQITMTSLEIAELTGKQHKHVLTDIRKMLAELGKDSAHFSAQYKDPTGRSLPCFKLDKLHTETLILGYSAKLRMKVLVRLNELEKKMQQLAIPQNFADALQLAADQARQIEAQKPAVEFVQKYVEADSLKGFREVCKLLNANERDFRQFLVDSKIVYRLGGAWTAYKPHIEAGRMDTKAATANGKAFNQIMFTAKGVAWIAEKWGEFNK